MGSSTSTRAVTSTVGPPRAARRGEHGLRGRHGKPSLGRIGGATSVGLEVEARFASMDYGGYEDYSAVKCKLFEDGIHYTGFLGSMDDFTKACVSYLRLVDSWCNP